MRIPPELWDQIERPADLQAGLKALAQLELRLDPKDHEGIERLRGLSRGASGALGRAAERTLFRLERDSQDWEIFTRNPEAAERGVIASRLQRAKEALQDDDPVERMHFLDGAARERRFEIGPVLLTRGRLERHPEVLAAYGRAIGRLCAASGVAVLKALSRHDDPAVRLGAVQGLAYQVGREPLRLLVERLGDPDREVQWAALEVLESLPLADQVEVMGMIPAERAPTVLVGCVQALESHLPAPQALELLRTWSRAADQELACTALLVLARVADATVEARIEQLSGDRDPRVQQAVALAVAAYEEAKGSGR